MICPGCAKEKTNLWHTAKSCIHKHSASTKVQKRVTATIKFWHEESETEVKICNDCKKNVLDGMSNGGNFE